MFTPDQLMAVEPAHFAAAIAATPDHELAEGMASEIRGQVLDEIFRRMEEHFDPKKSKKLDLVIHFEITGAPSGESDKYQVTIRDNTCSVSKEMTDKPKLGLTLDAVHFLKLATGNAVGMNLYIGGKLKVDGNIILATRLEGLFVIPEAAEAGAPSADAAPAEPTTAEAAPAVPTPAEPPIPAVQGAGEDV
ncbi:MAG: SCP2 sterol-binding domain-containing protein [Actinobacteria bacterium]|nr:SCP2 sterol-binding domain-containing protein [Actinomycetota bacterium]